MKARIIKNNNFETIGFEVMTENDICSTVFCWGLRCSDLHYVKTFQLNEEGMQTVCRLIALKQEQLDNDRIPTDFLFHSISNEQHDAISKAHEAGKCAEGYDCTRFEDRKTAIEAEIEKLIRTFI